MKIGKLVSGILSMISFFMTTFWSCALGFANAIRNTSFKLKKSQRILDFRMAFTFCFVFLAVDGVYALNEMSNGSSLNKIAETVKGCNMIGDFHEGRAWFCKNEKYGFIDKMGNVIVPAKYDQVADFKEERAWVAYRNDEGRLKCGYIDLDGKEVVPIKYQVPFGEGETPTDFSEGLAALPLRTDEYDSPVYGYIDKMGNEVIPAKFSIAGEFKNGIALVDLENYIDKTGKVLTGNELEFQDKIVIFSQDEKMGLKHLNGKVVVPCNYDVIQNFSDGMAAVCKGHLWGYVDPLGTFVIPCSYHSSSYYDNGVMDDWGEYGAPDEANDFHEGLVMVMRNRMAGFLNKQGETAIPFIYKRAKDFSEGLAAVKTAWKWGFVDKEGNNVIPCQYDTVASFKEGLVAAVTNGKCGYINANGQEVVPFIFDKPAEFELLHDFCEGLAVIKKNGVYGYVDKEGKSTFDVAANKTQQNSTKNGVIADYDEGTIYQGVYVFDAVLTDALLNKSNATFTITINGNNVSVPDNVQTMRGYIYRYDLNISVGYEHPNGIHYVSLQIKPNDREGTEWVGSYQVPGTCYDVVLKLRECKQQGSVFEVTKEGKTEEL